jgi:hypothetical protein
MALKSRGLFAMKRSANQIARDSGNATSTVTRFGAGEDPSVKTLYSLANHFDMGEELSSVVEKLRGRVCDEMGVRPIGRRAKNTVR